MQENFRQEELVSERTLLAADLTFAAWIRTGLAGVGGGSAGRARAHIQKF